MLFGQGNLEYVRIVWAKALRVRRGEEEVVIYEEVMDNPDVVWGDYNLFTANSTSVFLAMLKLLLLA
jgi:hypothetical protein